MTTRQTVAHALLRAASRLISTPSLFWLLAALPLTAATSSVWEMTSFSDFIKGKFDGVSLGRDGRLTLAPKLDTFFASEQPVIWSVVAGPGGALYAATGHRGRVFRIDPTGTPRVVWTADRPEVFALAADNRAIYAASSPDGKIYRIENGQATEYFDPKTKYIWALALAPDGTLYAGTGDGGRVFRITGPNQGEDFGTVGGPDYSRSSRLIYAEDSASVACGCVEGTFGSGYQAPDYGLFGGEEGVEFWGQG